MYFDLDVGRYYFKPSGSNWYATNNISWNENIKIHSINPTELSFISELDLNRLLYGPCIFKDDEDA